MACLGNIIFSYSKTTSKLEDDVDDDDVDIDIDDDGLLNTTGFKHTNSYKLIYYL